jgi:uncharacterized damage-inducible protein DinB
MSFGFSIGDIILLSQLTYRLYSSVSSGRKDASRDLRELEDVLFSLRCALIHLGEAAEDVLDRTKEESQALKTKLDKMMNACGATLKDLEAVTEKYRDVIVNEAGREHDERLAKRSFANLKRSAKVNWRKVRWGLEKQSLQQYREKLRAHADAINIILNSLIW